MANPAQNFDQLLALQSYRGELKLARSEWAGPLAWGFNRTGGN